MLTSCTLAKLTALLFSKQWLSVAVKLYWVINRHLKILSLLCWLFCSVCFFPQFIVQVQITVWTSISSLPCCMCLHVNEHKHAIVKKFTDKPLTAYCFDRGIRQHIFWNTVRGLIKDTDNHYNKQIQSTQKLLKSDAKKQSAHKHLWPKNGATAWAQLCCVKQWCTGSSNANDK